MNDYETADVQAATNLFTAWGLRCVVAPASSDVEVRVLWPHPDAMPLVTRAYVDASSTRLLHAVYVDHLAHGTWKELG